MKAYFQLQFRLFNRAIQSIGMPPLLGYVALLAVFIGSSLLLFARTEFAPYLYILLALSMMGRLGEQRRNDFLQMHFPAPQYRLIRLAENGIVALPFVLFLAYKGLFLFALALPGLSALLATLKKGMRWQLSFPTPFSRRPFEFPTGFRGNILWIGAAYFLTLMAIRYDNFNLGAFSLAAIFFTCLSFYTRPEREYYVWIFHLGPRRFLWEKMKTAWLFSALLSLPVWLALAFAFPENIYILAALLVLGWFYLVAIIVAKYSAYPGEMNISHAILLVLSIYLPPVLFVLIPVYYQKSVRNLRLTLYDPN